jgi:adenine-specific DNA methylase
MGKKIDLLGSAPSIDRFPSTRYQGSKRKLLGWIWESVSHLCFDSVLDLFSGTASVAYLFKVHGKTVTTNDYLRFNQMVARALISNSDVRLPRDEAEEMLCVSGKGPPAFIERTYAGVYYTDAENRWLDEVASRIHGLADGPQRALAYFALYQACLGKRPYNLFHRANLSMRTADVQRGFGNKATWEKPFEDHFLAALGEANRAVFDNGRSHTALRTDFLEVPGAFDLVYMDPPYLNARGTGVDYLAFYHFLEGLTQYPQWPSRITERYKHKPYARVPSPWHGKNTILGAFDSALEKYDGSIIVISYRSDGIPSIDDLRALLRRHGRRSAVGTNQAYQYVLSTAKGREVLLVSEPAGTRRRSIRIET